MRHAFAALVYMVFLAGNSMAEDEVAPVLHPANLDAKTIQIDGHTLGLAYSGKTGTATIKEFIAKGETLDHWTRLAAIREYPDQDDAKALAEGVLANLKVEERPSDYVLLENPKTGAATVAFFILPEDKSFAEYNVFHYMKRDGGGLVMYQYAQRTYGADDMIAMINDMTDEKRVAAIVETMKFATGLTD